MARKNVPVKQSQNHWAYSPLSIIAAIYGLTVVILALLAWSGIYPLAMKSPDTVDWDLREQVISTLQDVYDDNYEDDVVPEVVIVGVSDNSFLGLDSDNITFHVRVNGLPIALKCKVGTNNGISCYGREYP